MTLVAFLYITIPKEITKEDGLTVVNEIPHQKTLIWVKTKRMLIRILQLILRTRKVHC